MTVHKSDDLRTVAFKVCTALDGVGLTAVLTGGSAATVYAPAAYQSRNLDFVIEFVDAPHADHAKALTSLGYREHEGQYVHRENPLTLEFPPGPLSVGKELITKWDTLREGERLLHILRPIDCCRDCDAKEWEDWGVGLGSAPVVLSRATAFGTPRERTSGKCGS